MNRKRGRPKGSKNNKWTDSFIEKMKHDLDEMAGLDPEVKKDPYSLKMESIEYKTLRKVYELQFDLSKAHDAIYFGFIIIAIISLINIVIVISK